MFTGPTQLLLCLFGPLLAFSACVGEIAPEQQAIEWHQVPWQQGTLNVAVVRPDNAAGGPHPVIVALPWGSGSAQLVQTFIQRYWLTEPASRGYYVVSPEVRGSSLEASADQVVPAIFDWMQLELDFDPDQVALVGASNGGRGLFFAAVSQPARFGALMGLPGQYSGDASNLSALAGKPVRLIVGELDDSWVAASQATVAALATQGITAELDIVPGEGHVISLDPRGLMDWLDQALGR